MISLWDNNFGKYTLPTTNNDPILWRYSKFNTTWVPNEITGVDHATMLFGLSTLPEYLGSNFFSNNNDFFPLPTTLNLTEYDSLQNIKIFPNPATEKITIQLDKKYNELFLYVTNIKGQIVYLENFNKTEEIIIPLQMDVGIYFLTIGHSTQSKTFKIIKK